MDSFVEDVLPNMVEKNSANISQERVVAKARMEMLRMASTLRLKQDLITIHTLATAQEERWWANLGDEEFDTFDEFLGVVLANARAKDPTGGEISNWGWIARTLVPILRSHGLNNAQITAATLLKGKMRAAVSRLRFIEEQFKDDPDEAARLMTDIIENQVLNPKKTVEDIRKNSPGYKGARIEKLIPAAATGMVITDGKGGSMLTIRLDTPAQAKAVELAVKGLIDTSGGGEAFYPRDAISLAGETKAMLQKGHVEVQREPIRNLTDKMSVILPIPLAKLFQDGNLAVQRAISASLGEGYGADVERYEMVGFMSNELHIRFTLNIYRSEEVYAIYTRTSPDRQWSLKASQVGQPDVAKTEAARTLNDLRENHQGAQVTIKVYSAGDEIPLKLAASVTP